MATVWNELQTEKPTQAHRPEMWMERLIWVQVFGGAKMTTAPLDRVTQHRDILESES